jgi:hypothetical protein
MSIATIEQRAQIITEPAESYHARSEISRGMLADFHQRRRVYEGRYLSRTIPPKKPTKQMEIGTLVHAAILEPHRINELYTQIPDDLLASNGAVSTKAAKEFVANAQARGQYAVKADDWAMVKAMAASVNTRCEKLLSLPGQIEQTIVWTHPLTGLQCRCRPDWLRETADKVFCIDLKTTADASPEQFKRRIEEHSYWLQDSHYSEGAELLTKKPVTFLFVAVECEPPYGCGIYKLTPRSRQRSRDSRERIMLNLSACLDAGNFADPWEGEINEVEVYDKVFE